MELQATYKLPLASHITLLTFQKFAVPAITVQLTPWSVLIQIPAPLTASALIAFSPVPKYMMFTSEGSWQILPMERLPKKSLIGVQVAGFKVMSFVFHNPPSIPPTHTVLPVASPRSSQMARTRPEVLPLPGRVFPLLAPTASLLGPRSVQEKREEAVLFFIRSALMRYASTSLPLGT